MTGHMPCCQSLIINLASMSSLSEMAETKFSRCSLFFALLALLFFRPATSVPSCSLVFGHPSFSSCLQLVNGGHGHTGIRNIDRRLHLFTETGWSADRPEHISTHVWRNNQIYLPQFWANGKSLLKSYLVSRKTSVSIHRLNGRILIEGCKAALLLNNVNDGNQGFVDHHRYDVGTYPEIADVGQPIVSTCVYTGFGGLSRGGWDRTGM